LETVKILRVALPSLCVTPPLYSHSTEREREREPLRSLHSRYLFLYHELFRRNVPWDSAYTAHILHPCTLFLEVGQFDDTLDKHRVLSAVSLFCLPNVICHFAPSLRRACRYG